MSHLTLYRVRKLMGELGIRGCTPNASKRTTVPDPRAGSKPDLVRRGFRPPVPTTVLVGDITYLRTGEGWLYLATVIDLATRMVVGWSLSRSMTADIAAALEFDEERLAADEACDGYYLIVTSETGMDDDAVIEAYRGLWRIEESFKVTKSDLETRPVHVSRREHIEAHFLTCYVALCILRIMQARCGGRYSAGRIAGELAALSCTSVAGNWWVFDHRSEVTDELCRMAGFDASRRFAQTKDIKAMFSKAKRGPGSAT